MSGSISVGVNPSALSLERTLAVDFPQHHGQGIEIGPLIEFLRSAVDRRMHRFHLLRRHIHQRAAEEGVGRRATTFDAKLMLKSASLEIPSAVRSTFAGFTWR